jgi:hypothetical protein
VFITGVNDTGNKLSSGDNDTGDMLSPMSLFLAKDFHRCRKTLYDCKQQPNSISTKQEKTFHLLPVLLTPVINLYFQIPPQIFAKIPKGPHGIIRGPGGN